MPTSPTPRRRHKLAPVLIASAAALVLLAGGCAKKSDLPDHGDGTTGGSGSGAGRAADGTAKVDVVAGFYPFAYLAETIGGDHVTVDNLTKPGAEPHDLELTPSQIAAVGKADLAIYENGLQSDVDKAVAQQKPKASVDVASVIHLEDHGDLGEGDSHGHDHNADPHVWLDPVDFQKIAATVSAALQKADPAHAAEYRANATALDAKLITLDAGYKTGLAQCKRTDIVTSHAAFGYLAERYGLTQVPIAGLSPDSEPSAKHLADILKLIKQKGVTTVFFETLASPKTAQTLASDTGTKAAVLDPLEGVEDTSKNDYLTVMRENLAALETALGCS